MDIKIFPTLLSGTVSKLQSKSYAHRNLIALALAGNMDFSPVDLNSDDIKATADGLLRLSEENPTIDSHESGTTLRMLLPILAVTKNKSHLVLGHQLANRPIDPLINAINRGGCQITRDNLNIYIDGNLKGGDFYIPGNISSQFISGLLYALPLCQNDSHLYVNTEIQSRPYVDMTLKVLRDFGISIDETKSNQRSDTTVFNIKGGQKYISPKNLSVETDWSNSAFWLTSNFLGSQIKVNGLREDSLQGDKGIVAILKRLKTSDQVEINLSDIPDLLPTLAIAASYRKPSAVTRFTNIARLHIKESDRVFSTRQMILNLGGKFFSDEDQIVITSKGGLSGGIVDAYDDHRIVMAAAVGATLSKEPVTILGAQAVNKSYPNFFEQYQELGGKIVKL